MIVTGHSQTLEQWQQQQQAEPPPLNASWRGLEDWWKGGGGCCRDSGVKLECLSQTDNTITCMSASSLKALDLHLLCTRSGTSWALPRLPPRATS